MKNIFGKDLIYIPIETDTVDLIGRLSLNRIIDNALDIIEQNSSEEAFYAGQELEMIRKSLRDFEISCKTISKHMRIM